eukprot:gene645-10349_t
MRREIEDDTATASCANAPLSSPRSGSCVGMEDEIEVGGAGFPCCGVPP